MEAAGVSAAMAWSPLPQGGFSGIDWGPDGACDGYDPYLVWAEASRFAGYRLKAPPSWLPVLVELAPDCSIGDFERAGSEAWLRVAKVYTSEPELAGLRICAAWIGRSFFAALQPGGVLHDKVKRFELGLPMAHHVEPPPELRGQALDEDQRLQGNVLGLVDGGLAFANQNFLQERSASVSGLPVSKQRARTRFFWRQDAQGVGESPAALGYGHELRAEVIEDAMEHNTFGGLVDEEAVYRHFKLTDLRKRINHGTHVMDLACGPRTLLSQVANLPPDFEGPPSWALADDAASRSDLVAVQLDWSNVVDTSGGSMNVSIMDALMYILSRCARTARVVVNISWGTLAGPHNGSSVLERAMDELMRLKAGQLQIVLPAGNGYQDRLHANATLARGESMHLDWKLLPDDSTQSFLELWLPADAQGVTVSVRPPGAHAALPPLSMGQSGMWTDGSGNPLAALIFPRTVATGTGGTCALLALAPTFRLEADAVTGPCGLWHVEITNAGEAAVTVDAYVERDDVALGQHTGARQSYFEDSRYDTSGNPSSFFDQPVALSQQLESTLIRRSGTFNSVATGERPIAVGGVRIVGDDWSQWSLYSPRQPDPDASRPQREGVVRVPVRMAYGDENPMLLGLRAAGTLSGSVVRLVGTSGSAPQVTRALFNRLSPSPAPPTSEPAASS
jgi:hypothetical protein